MILRFTGFPEFNYVTIAGLKIATDVIACIHD